MILEAFSCLNKSMILCCSDFMMFMIFVFFLQYNEFELQAHFKASDHICKIVFIANKILTTWRPPS